MRQSAEELKGHSARSARGAGISQIIHRLELYFTDVDCR